VPLGAVQVARAEHHGEAGQRQRDIEVLSRHQARRDGGGVPGAAVSTA
jgi:hypothetical protein